MYEEMELLTDNLDELLILMDKHKSEADAIHDNPQVIVQYKARKLEIEKEEAALANIDANFQKVRHRNRHTKPKSRSQPNPKAKPKPGPHSRARSHPQPNLNPTRALALTLRCAMGSSQPRRRGRRMSARPA